jgi:hypothetical protein
MVITTEPESSNRNRRGIKLGPATDLSVQAEQLTGVSAFVEKVRAA